MSYILKTDYASKSNYGSVRSLSSIKYIVIHYTANDGDADENNGNYFENNYVGASAHYFVDSDSVTKSVPDNYVAWSVGGSKYSNCYLTGGGKYYGQCSNTNSISIEICDDIRNGVVYPSAKTIANTIELTKKLMEKYGVPASRVIRHFDVTGKSCPAYWCGSADKNKKWKTEFHNKLTEKKAAVSKKENTTKSPENKTTANTFKPYKVKVIANVLNVRNGAGTNHKINTEVKKGEVYTIVKEKKNGSTVWGKLKSGAGWIALSYTNKV